MSPKFYTYLWIAFFSAAIVVFLGGAFTMFAGVVFGFVAFGLVFTGMMCVLPAQVAHANHPATVEVEPVVTAEKKLEPIASPDPVLVRLRSA